MPILLPMRLSYPSMQKVRRVPLMPATCVLRRVSACGGGGVRREDCGLPRLAVRLLHAGHGGRVPRGANQGGRAQNRGLPGGPGEGAGRQPVPVHRLPPHPGRLQGAPGCWSPGTLVVAQCSLLAADNTSGRLLLETGGMCCCWGNPAVMHMLFHTCRTCESAVSWTLK